jgi:hypothetical protein
VTEIKVEEKITEINAIEEMTGKIEEPSQKNTDKVI